MRRENLKQAVRPVRIPTQGSIPRLSDHDLSQNRESDTQLTEPPRHPEINFNKRKIRLTNGGSQI